MVHGRWSATVRMQGERRVGARKQACSSGAAGSTETALGVKGNQEAQLPLSVFKIVSHSMKDASSARGQRTRLQSVALQPAHGPVSPDISNCSLEARLACENKQESRSQCP